MTEILRYKSLRQISSLLICSSLFLLSACDTPQETTKSKAHAESMACLTEVMYFEARGTGEVGMRAVGEVVLNRVADPRFPNSVCGVVKQKHKNSCQFSYTCDGHKEVYREPEQKALSESIALVLLTNRGEDITKGALFFHAKSIRAGWFARLEPKGQFGRQLFYR